MVLTLGDLFWPTGTGRGLQVGEDILFDKDDKDEVAKEGNLGKYTGGEVTYPAPRDYNVAPAL